MTNEKNFASETERSAEYANDTKYARNEEDDDGIVTENDILSADY